MNRIQMIHRKPARQPDATHPFGVRAAQEALAFHRSMPSYCETPLFSLRALARALDVASIHVKDESQRFDLNAFKVLGGSFCISRILAERFDLPKTDFAALTQPELRAAIRGITFVTATDGNHGRGVAWTANRLGCSCVVYMPRGSACERLENIRALGADAAITDMNYDDTVRFARAQAQKNGWVLVQDTAWDGYTEIPARIMQGYTTMGCEIAAQLGGLRPTHIFLQAGVGAMAGAMADFFMDLYRGAPPVITVVEPLNADCIFRTAAAGDGRLHSVGGDLRTIMAGLACGEPCSIGWEMLARSAQNYVSMPDYVAANGMRILACPLDGDPRIVAGESGASGFGFAAEVLRNPELSQMKAQLGLNAQSRLLCISTEGATDRANYRSVVWDGAYAK